MTVIYFIVLVGVLIFVHELGHFVWAKFFGVRVLRFSLGFGPRLFGFQGRETEYVVAALPLGGYVKMLGEGHHDVVAPEEEPRAFHSQPLWKRFVIVVAGPAMNLLFPIILFFVVFLGDTHLPPPVVGTVYPGRPADGRLLPGDRIVAVGGEEVQTFYDVSTRVAQHPGVPLDFLVERRGQKVHEMITPTLSRTVRELDRVEETGRVGIRSYHPTPVVGVTSPDSPAAAAGLRTFDVVVAVGGRSVERWIDLEAAVFPEDSHVPLTYFRPRRVHDALGGFVEMAVYEAHVGTVVPEPGREAILFRMGLEPAELYVHQVTAGSPEHLIGLLPGDRLLTLDGRPVRRWATFLEDLKAGRGREHVLTWRRGTRYMTGRYRLRVDRGVSEDGQAYEHFRAGIQNWMPVRFDPRVENPIPFRYSFERALDRTAEILDLTVVSIVRLFQGRLSVKSLGGPIAMFDAAGVAAREGAVNYLTIMAFISVNLGLINLLPIPMLDGGHVLFILIETVSRRSVSARVRQYASLIGLAILLVLMTIAFKNDIERKWPQIVDWITGR